MLHATRRYVAGLMAPAIEPSRFDQLRGAFRISVEYNQNSSPNQSAHFPPSGSTALWTMTLPMVIRTVQSMSVVLFLLATVCAGATFAEEPKSESAAQPDDLPTLAEAREIGRRGSNLRQSSVPQNTASLNPNLAEFDQSIRPIMDRACVVCHGEDTQEGNLRIDALDPDLQHGNDIDWWLEIQAVLSTGEMPPPEDTEFADVDRARVVEWLSNEIQTAAIVRRASGSQSSFRRMTRYEFNYALQDLLGLPYHFAKDLPPEANSDDGFQNSSEVLHMSVSQLETYRRLARNALLRATVRGKRPPVLRWGVTMQDAGRIEWSKQDEQFEKARIDTADDPAAQEQKLSELEKQFSQPHPVPYFRNLTTGRTVRAHWEYYHAKHANKVQDSQRSVPETLDHVAILPRGGNRRFTIELGNRVPDEGTMRVRVRASRANKDDSGHPSLQLLFGWQASNEGRAVLAVPNGERVVSADPEEPQFLQWDVPLGEIYPRNSVRATSTMGAMPNPSEYIRLVNSSVSQGPIQIDYVEVQAPVYDQWPPASHQRIFIESNHREDEQQYAREVILAFMQRAWRRTISDEELNRKLKLFAVIRPTCETFDEAVVEVLATVMASPQFLYVSGNGTDELQLASHELAIRLSMFLWCSIPDSDLCDLASSGSLQYEDVLSHQVTRMLSDDRSTRLAEHFVHQWLDMQLLEFRSLPRHLESLREAMQEEPIAVFSEILRKNASVLDFLHADYTLVNERLAQHYGLPGVKGNHFQRVTHDSDYQRGGLLTQAGLLMMNSAGDDSHPLKRGVWLLESLLNDPPPPPPPAVPEIDLADPEIATMTLKERIEDHRNHAACRSCHAKIDPWGIAFENYDALGRWRDQVKDKPVDATSTLFGRQPIDGMLGLKRYLLEHRQDQFVRAMVHKLTTYALGRPLTFADRAEVDRITSRVRQQGDGLATMIKLIATSDLFRTK